MRTHYRGSAIAGNSLALGMAWHLDNGFFTILGETFLGWIYVAYKLTEKFYI